MAADITVTDGSLCVSTMSNEELGTFVAEQTIGVLRRLYELRPYYEELWRRFDALPSGATINGCRTRTEFCKRILRKSVRSVQYALHGRNANNVRVRAQIGDGEETCVERLRRSAFGQKCPKHDPILYAFQLAQCELVDKGFETGDQEYFFAAAAMEGRIVRHICRDVEQEEESWFRAYD